MALTRVDGHAVWANSAALAAAGIDRHRADPAGGRIVRGGDGEPTGLLIDTAQDLVRAVQPALSSERFEGAVRAAIAHLTLDALARGFQIRRLRLRKPSASSGQRRSPPTRR